MSDRQANSPEFPVESLTRREREVLALLAEGLTSPEIAERLTLATSSVKTHIQHLYGKLGVNGKRQAVKRARELGLLKPELGVAQIVASSPQAEPPRPKHNLPLQVTRFFGRGHEIAQVKVRLADWRLVTLTGSGGVGKTRLALQVTSELLNEFPDGVWLVELASLADPALVPQTAATVLDVKPLGNQPVLTALTHYLRAKHLLLVLDNCEHLIAVCAQLAEALLRACPNVHLLATSREALGIEGEAILPVPSLSLPNAQNATLAAIAEAEAVQLFVERSMAALPGFALSEANAATIAQVCRRLDGIALAIELAASRVKLLTVEQIATRLDDAFHFLTGGSRTALPRQQTLRATIDWSYNLLAEEERQLLGRLVVFAGGWTLEAAEAVCSGEGLNSGQVLDRLAGLVDKSMVIADRQPGEATRYRLPEMVQQYARDKLQEREELWHLHRRHRDYFLQFAKTNLPRLASGERLIWTRKMMAEQDNLRLAMEWSFTDETDIEAGPSVVMAILAAPFAWQEKFNWFNRAISWCQGHEEISAAVYASLLGHATHIVMMNDPLTALAMAQQAVDISRRLGPEGKPILMQTLLNLAGTYIMDLHDDEQGLAAYIEAEALFQELGPDKFPPEEYLGNKANFAIMKASMALHKGQYRDVKLHARESIRICEEASNPWATFLPQLYIGTACLNLGEYEEAREHFLKALDLVEETEDFWAKALIRSSLGMTEYELGSLDQALGYFEESLRQAEQVPDRNIIASGLAWCARISAKQNQPFRAAVLSGAAQALYKKQNREPREDSSLDTLLPGWRDGPDHEAITQAHEAGQAMNAEQAAMYALGETAD